MDDRIAHVVIVVPVRNEEGMLGTCLEHLGTAMDQLHRQRPEVSVGLTVVLDRCEDSSASIAARFEATDQRIAVVAGDFGSVGSSRAAGISRALDNLGQRNPRSRTLSDTWIACTDADTRVPSNWLTRSVELAESGFDVLTGTVEPDSAELDRELFSAWQRGHCQTEGHHHVHGANLGIRASEYRAVGGFDPVAQDEDVLVVRRLRINGARFLATGKLHAITSGRIQGRVGSGFSGYLRSLQNETAQGANTPNT
ncbi:MAG: glycosyltransferase [Micrococcaceae bacterium]|nr:glycosyltransferase [Micrococcaceae bacterium]